ncbi:hypothetical protein Btru_041242 [Bulinus truncatus]|nr:hypothetical protein Btru_041242 [Bulinus truncatus]
MLSISHDFKFFLSMAYLISLQACVVHTYQPNITVVLEQFNQSNAITKCSSDLLVNNTFTIYGTVMTSKPLHDMSGQLFIFFNEKDNKKEETFYVNSLKECTGDKKCGWEELCCNICNNSIKIWITLPAPELYSEATLRLTVSYLGQRYNSSAIKLPKIIDPSKIEIAYNRRSLTQGITIKNGENVLTLCCLNAPKDCRPFVLHQPCPQSTYSTNCITCTVNTTQNGSFPLGFNVCGLEMYTPGNITTVATNASPGKL